MDQVDLEIELPLPPSVNHYWRYPKGMGHPIISRAGRIFRLVVKGRLAEHEVEDLHGRLVVEVDVYQPPARRVDVDNVLKALLDALQHGGLYANDGAIDDLHIINQQTIVPPSGAVVVRIGRI